MSARTGTRPFARLASIMRSTGVLVDPGTWIVPGKLLACAYPRREAALDALTRRGVSRLINLHERAHQPSRLARHGLEQVHVPIRDFTAPTPDQIERVLSALDDVLANGRTVAIHCGGGLGRTGTLLACSLVRTGLGADEAIARLRALRPGSVETRAQVAAVTAYAECLGARGRSGAEI